MRLAQSLYEAGHITYMRTDSTNLSQEGQAEISEVVRERFGARYHHGRKFATKSKGAQEAHEAIRPASVARAPEALSSELERDSLRLYEMI